MRLLAPIRLSLGLCLLTSCATPVPPTGGPPDETPPEILESAPVSGSVNVERESIQLTFSEYIDEQSFTQAFAVTPSFSRPPEFAWGRRSVEIRFPEPLRENTTYVVTLDSELRDIHGVALSRPITLAFSTGPTISAGTITGRVVSDQSGEPAAGVDIFAYALVDSAQVPQMADVPESPDYRTQTDPTGTFTFEYLTEQPYFVAALRDQNRNLQADQQESFAPPPIPSIPADTTPVDIGLPWVLTAIDTTRPTPTRVLSLSRTRHRLRFSEPVRFTERDPAAWTLLDSAAAEPVPIQSLYTLASEPREVYFTTDALTASRHVVTPSAVADTAGNLVLPEPIPFTPAAAEDTLALRLLAILPSETSVLSASMQPRLRFNTPVDQDQLAAIVSVQDTTGSLLPYSAVTEDGTEYAIHPDPELAPGARIQVNIDEDLLANLDSTFTHDYSRVPRSETGEISGTVLADSIPVVVEVTPIDVEIPVLDQQVRTDSAGYFIIGQLPAGDYRLRAFVDLDNDTRWDGGRLRPYEPPERIIWRDEPIRVRARWETSLPDTLRIPSP